MFLCLYKNMFFLFFLFMHVFFILETCKIKPICLVTLHCFLHSLRSSRAVSYIEFLFCMGDIVMKQA